ncbi:hypothetical protein [Enterococcus sp. 5H]|uniref:hypothetical protein n=1 Tax=Enterococcus sp. 5H TaxID=1229490 RepID=UPI002303A609|nr:hypothetical protein [Enterococcus sp. 5H]MDA9472133.1 hypothetical protein [Enterococcus sp. 5H]
MLCNSLWENNIQIFDAQMHKQELMLTLDETDSLFNRKIFDIFGCLILDCTLDRSEEIEISQEQFEAVIEYNTDRTGYEYSSNEFRIIDYIEKDLSIKDQYLLTMSYIQYLNSRLTLMTKNKIYYILFCNETILQMRFYQEWQGDSSLFSKNIEDFDHPFAMYASNDVPCNRVVIKP